MMILVRGAAKGLADERRIEAPATWLNDLLRTLEPGRWILVPEGIWVVVCSGARRRGGHAVHAVRPASLLDRLERAHGATLRRRREPHEDRGLHDRRRARGRRGRAAVLAASRSATRRWRSASSSTSSPPSSSAAGSLSGGRGTVLGTVLGATTMAVIQIGCAQRGPAELGAADRHGDHHRARRCARSVEGRERGRRKSDRSGSEPESAHDRDISCSLVVRLGCG